MTNPTPEGHPFQVIVTGEAEVTRPDNNDDTDEG